MSTLIDPRIFRAYDIRGKAYEQVSVEACRAIGHAFGSDLREGYVISEPAVAVGRDARTHGPELEAALVEGLVSAGCHVVRIGQCPSPVNYFTVCRQRLDGGVHVTASHNPPEDNGLKLCVRGGEAFSGEHLQRLLERIRKGLLLFGPGYQSHLDASAVYAEYVSGLFAQAGTGRRVVVDGGNGVAGPLYCDVLKRAGASVQELYTQPDGRFPNHPADPSKHATLRELQELVRTTHADVGFAFDGDGDRLGVVDASGHIRTADEILLLLASDHLGRHPGAPVVFTVSNSGILDSEIRSLGGSPVMCKVGHSHVEHAMRKHGSLLGGEQSGHFFCAEGYFPFDDALVAALRVLLILDITGKPLSELLAAYPRVYQAPERRPFCPDDHKLMVIDGITEHFARTYPVDILDGVRIDFGNGAWAGIRQSNTSPCISICIEARSQEHLTQVEREVLEHVKTYEELVWE